MPRPRQTILVVEDEAAIADTITYALRTEGFAPLWKTTGRDALAVLAAETVALVVLDVGLPDMSGLDVCRELRKRHTVPVIFLTARSSEVDKIVGLELGADDYLAKPFDLRELHARLKSVARRYLRPVVSGVTAAQHTAPGSRRLSVGDCRLDLDRQQLFDAAGQEIAVTAMEFELLRVFAERPNRPLSRDTLLDLTQNREWDPFDRSIDIRIARLRRKIETDPEKPRIIRTVRGVGYMFCRPD